MRMETALSYAYYQTQTIFVQQYINNPDEKGPELVSELEGASAPPGQHNNPYFIATYGGDD